MAPSLSPPGVRFPNPHAGRTLRARWWPGVRPFACSPIRVAGMLPVLLVLGLHALAYVTAVSGSLYPLLPRFPLPAGVLLLLFHFCFLSALANYLLLVAADPGSPPDDWKAPAPVVAIRTPPATSPSSSVASGAPPAPGAASPPDDRPQEDDGYPLPPVKHGVYIRKFKHAHLMRERTSDGYLRYCDACRAYKPDRSHHCSVCRRCILRMDHHCVFVNNCVSFYNHKFFVSFVFFAFLGCAITAIVAFPTFADIVAVVPPRLAAPAPAAPPPIPVAAPAALAGARRALDASEPALRLLSATAPPRASRSVAGQSARHVTVRLSLDTFSAASSLSTALKTAVMVGYITSTAFAFALAIFVGLHLVLVSKGRTTIEMYEMADPARAPRVAEYDLGCARNFRNVFGAVPMCWLLPTRAFIPGDGLSYDRKSDALSGDGAA